MDYSLSANSCTCLDPSLSQQKEEDTFLYAFHLATAATLPMALTCAIDLNLLQLIKNAGPGASLSASQLAAQIPTANPNPHQAATVIDRILRFLAASSVLNCHLHPLPDGGSGFQRFYSLAPVCKYLTGDEEDGGVSLASLSLANHGKVMMETWYHMKDVVINGGIAFNRAYGMSAFEYPAKDSTFNKVFNQGMQGSTAIVMKKILQTYRGFEDLNSKSQVLVDVGGGTGASLRTILSKYPSIKAINFDLPHVIEDAPSYPGVEHISGDMFVEVPKADAIFMKWICHDWSDAHCQKLLKKCYEALPEENGKVIIAEMILPKDSAERSGSGIGSGMQVQPAAVLDVIMLAYNPGGRERSEEEFEALAKHAGFKRFHKVCSAFSYWIMEFHK